MLSCSLEVPDDEPHDPLLKWRRLSYGADEAAFSSKVVPGNVWLAGCGLF